MKRIAIIPFVVLASTSLMGQQTQLSDTVALAPVEVRATRAGENSPFTKTDVSRAQLEKQNLGPDLPILLNQAPSVVVHSDAGNGMGYTGLRIRGTDMTRINVTLNGIPYNDAESQGSFFVDLPDISSSVGSIQIQRGVGTSSNGAASFGATLNISTNEVNKNAYAEISNSFGSFNSVKNTIRAGTGLLKEHFTVDARLSRLSSDGYIDRAHSNLQSYYISAAWLAKKSSLRFNTFSGKERTYQAWNGISEADLRAGNRTLNSAGTEKPGTPYRNEVDDYTQNHYQLFYNQDIGNNLHLNTAFFLTRGLGYYEQYKAEQAYADYGLAEPGPGTTTTDLTRRLWLDNYFYGNTFSLFYRKGVTEMTFGGGFNQYNGDHYGNILWAQNGSPDPDYRWYFHDATKQDFSVYFKQQNGIAPRLFLFYDLQYRHVNYMLNGFRNNPGLIVDRSFNFFNPKIGLSYVWQKMKLYGSFSRGSKEPNRDDFEAGANQQPKPEFLNDLEAGIEKNAAKYSWSANIYYMAYRDQLVLTGKINDVGAYTRTNVPESYRLGLELQGAWKPTHWLSLNGNLTLSRNKVKSYEEFIDDYDNGGQKTVQYSNTDIALSPAITGYADISFIPATGFEISLIEKYVSKQYLDNSQRSDRQLDPYFTQDLRLRYQFNKGWLKNSDLIFQLNNVFDAKYEPNGYTYSYVYGGERVTENYYYPMAGINFMAGINIRL